MLGLSPIRTEPHFRVLSTLPVIQQMQAPARIDTEPGLTIDVAFYPMREVGKDFYLGPTPGASACALATEEEMRMAAMAATLPLGALRRRTATRPVSRLSEPRAVQEPHARHRHLPMFHALNLPAVVKAQN